MRPGSDQAWSRCGPWLPRGPCRPEEAVGGARLRPRGARQLYRRRDRGLPVCRPGCSKRGRAEEEGQVPSDVETLSSFWKPVSGTL